MKTRISDSVYAATEPERFRKECKYIAKKFVDDRDNLKLWIQQVSGERGIDAAIRLSEGVMWLWKKYDKNK